MKGEEERCLAAGMDAYLAKPVNIDRLRATLERWLPIDETATATAAPDDAEAGRAIDRDVLARLARRRSSAIDSLLAKFRDTAIDAEREIDAASRAGDLAALAAAAHKLKGAAQAVGAKRRRHRRRALLEQAGKAGDRARCRDGLGPLASSCAGRWPRSTTRAASVAIRKSAESPARLRVRNTTAKTDRHPIGQILRSATCTPVIGAPCGVIEMVSAAAAGRNREPGGEA